MTITEALQNITAYPLGENSIQVILIERGLDGAKDFTAEVSQSNAYKGAKADLYMQLFLAPNVSEGGMSISLNDRTAFRSMANSLYKSIGETDKISGASVKFIGYR